MSSKRRLVCMPPVEAINGKFVQNKEKVTENERYGKVQYYAGFQRSISTNNYFSLRKNARSTPYNAQEILRQNWFKMTAKMTAEIMSSTDMAEWREQFRLQSKYRTLRGFVFGTKYAQLGDELEWDGTTSYPGVKESTN